MVAMGWTVVDIFILIGFQKFKLLQNGESRPSDKYGKSETIGNMASTMLGCSVDEVNKAIIQMKKKQQLGENMLLFSPSACSQ